MKHWVHAAPNVSCATGWYRMLIRMREIWNFSRDSVDRMRVATSCNVQPNVPNTRSVKLNVERPMQVLRTMVPLKTLSELCPPELDFVRVHVSPSRRLDMKTVEAYQVNIPASNLVKHGMGNGFPSMHPSPSTSSRKLLKQFSVRVKRKWHRTSVPKM